jgi:hypothetical protein
MLNVKYQWKVDRNIPVAQISYNEANFSGVVKQNKDCRTFGNKYIALEMKSKYSG